MKTIFTIFILLLSFIDYSQTYEITKVTYNAKVKKMAKLNTNGLEFSPVWVNNQLVFTSNREFDLLTVGENNWSNTGFLNLYHAKLKQEDLSDSVKIKNIKLFSQQIKSSSHTGPVCFSMTGDTIFYSQTQEKDRWNRRELYQPQLFMAVKKGNEWGKIQHLPINDENYSFSHPSYDSKTQTLYFVSNKPGGKGGKDIYSTRWNGAWSDPENLKHINTNKDEVFPFVLNNDIFFSSNKDGGLGNLDIYWANLNPKAKVEKLNGINSTKDDFGIFITPDNENGFVSSNRNGNDDIFYIYFEKTVTVNRQLAGRFKYRNLESNADGLKVLLIDEDGNFDYETVTANNGEFKFENLDLDNYQIKVLSEEELDLFVYNEKGEIISKLISDKEGLFTYRKLDFNNVSTLHLMPENQKDFDNNSGLLTGQFLYTNQPGKYPNNLKVILKDFNDVDKISVLTDHRGNFSFKNLSLTENYLLTINEDAQDLTLLIFDKLGNVTAQLKSNSKGQFLYRKLNGDFASNLKYLDKNKEPEFELDTKTISGNFNYRNLEGNFKDGLTVYIYSEDGILLATEKTNEKGEFRYRSLPISDNFLFKIEENGSSLSMDEFTLFLEDRYGKKVAELQRGENGYFIFKPLGLNTNNNLSLITEDTLGIDYVPPALNNKHLVKKVYFNSNRAETKKSDLEILNEIYSKMKANPELRLEINAYADSRSSDEYNLILSGKRGQWIVDYLVKKGIPKSKMIVNAYGEGQLAVKCISCTDADHAKNRRAEIRLY